MSESAIRTAIYNILSGITDIGKVYDYERWAADWSKFINLFKTTISGVDQIRGWEIGRRSAGEKPFTIGLNLRDHGFVIRGYMRVNNASASEKTFNNLIEAVADAFRNNFTLNGAAESHDYIQAVPIDFRVFGNVLCHYAELSLNVHEEKNIARPLPEIFGYSENIYSGEGMVAPGDLWGSFFECPNSGMAISMNVYLKQVETRTPRIKCAIYSDSGGVPNSLIGYTEEWILTSGFEGWKTLNFISGGNLVPGDIYWLIVWADDYFYGRTFTGLTHQLVVAGKAYNSFPVTFPAGSFNNNKALIYCAYRMM